MQTKFLCFLRGRVGQLGLCQKEGVGHVFFIHHISKCSSPHPLHLLTSPIAPKLPFLIPSRHQIHSQYRTTVRYNLRIFGRYSANIQIGRIIRIFSLGGKKNKNTKLLIKECNALPIVFGTCSRLNATDSIL